jgi:hypothetical protein
LRWDLSQPEVDRGKAASHGGSVVAISYRAVKRAQLLPFCLKPQPGKPKERNEKSAVYAIGHGL